LSERISLLREKEEREEELSKVEIEILRLADAVESVLNHSEKTVETHNLNESENPLGEVGGVTLLLFADLHHAPSNPETQIREQAFKRYALVRAASKVVDKFAEGKAFTGVEGRLLENTGDDKSPENVYKRYILREAALAQYRDWLEGVVKSGMYDEGSSSETRPVLVSLGDVVHDGASLDAQLSERSAFREILDVTKKNDTLLMEINGNHDNDSRVPESVTMLTELYGHGVFTQEVAGGVLMAAIDTNIENPKWVDTFISKTGETGEKLIRERRELQEAVKDKIRNHKGPIVLLGHNPSRIVEALSVKEDLLQKSNVQRIIAGHTHKEDHIVLPFKNGSGDPIVMDVIESFVKVEDGKPQPPKLYALDIRNGIIGDVRTLQEPEDAFVKGVDLRL
jgi:predicted phosphohydrolase